MVRVLALGVLVVGSLAIADPAPVTKMHDASAVLTELLARTDSVA